MNWAALRFAGFHKLDDNYLFVGSTAADIAGLVSDAKFIPFIGYVFNIADNALFAVDFFVVKDYQVNEAMFNHIDRDNFRAGSRVGVEMSFNRIKSNINHFINNGTIGVKKGSEMFLFDGRTSVYEYDPLYDKKIIFRPDEYYFVLYDSEQVGLFNNTTSWTTKR